MALKEISESHFPQIEKIYLEGIATGTATFQTVSPNWENWDSSHFQHSRLAFIENNEMAAWAALSPVSSRCVYSGVGEVSIYVAEKFRGKGIGKKLLKELILESEENGLWTLQSGIFSENTASINLHESCGFRQIGFRERIGQLNGIWKNNVIMERRSRIIGI